MSEKRRQQQVGLSMDGDDDGGGGDSSSSSRQSPASPTLFPIVSFTNSNLDEDALSPILKPKKRPLATHSSTFRTDVSLTSSKNNSTTTENNTHRSRTNSEPFFKKQFESIRVGVIAMDKKMKSKAMQAILSRMKDFTLYKIGTQMLMNEDVSRWPKVDVVMFKRSSADMPMSKILEFCKLHRPLLINDIATQHDVLSDRRLVYETLQRVGVPVPEHFVMNRDGPKSTWTPMEEYEDYIVVDGERVDKPFVEKPVSGDDHNIYIYYPSSSGGGSKRMFRKRKNRSSQFYPDVSTVRREGSYIYEAYMHTNGTDVKVYTVGPQYAHAEARKAPTLDGIVVRDENGKERRFPVRLNSQEKMYASKIVLAFKQNVCGFDILRTDDLSYVCDVNGWSMVKNSPKYWDDCSHILTEIILQTLDPSCLQRRKKRSGSASDKSSTTSTKSSILNKPQSLKRSQSTMQAELRCVIGVFRHGDRTPKQKMKMKTSNITVLSLFHRYCNKKYGQGLKSEYHRRTRNDNSATVMNSETRSIYEREVLLRTASELQDVLDMARTLLRDIRVAEDESDNSDSELPVAKLIQLKTVLEMYGGFKGINRKVQLKPKKWSVEKDKDGVPRRIATEVLLVLKWGGVLTERGELQASHIGKTFRAAMYPKTDVLGLGLLRLHSTFRHDLKIYSSDEGRCLMTAAAFAKSFLDLEGELPPILTSLVRPAPLMLNSLPETAREKLNEIKTRLHKDLATASKVDDDLIEKIAPTRDQELLDAVNSLSPNPRKRLYRLSELLTTLVEALRKLHAGGKKSLDEIELYGGESLLLMYNRWKKLQRDLYHKRKDRFDMSKIPDVYDTVVYDLLHNRKFFRNHAHLKIVMDELYCLAKASASLVISQEYGVTKNEKLTIACSVADNLFYKVHADLVNASTGDDENGDTRLDADFIEVSENVPFIKSPRRHIRTRLYFTSESHIHSLVNALRHGTDVKTKKTLIMDKAQRFMGKFMKHSYMSHVVLRLWELPSFPKDDPRRWRVDLCHGGGACPPKIFGKAVMHNKTKAWSKECISPESPRLGAPPAPTSHENGDGIAGSSSQQNKPRMLKRSSSPVQYYGAEIEPLRSLNAKLTLNHVQSVLMECANRGSVLNKRMVREKSKLKLGSVGSHLNNASNTNKSDGNSTTVASSRQNLLVSPVRLPPPGKSSYFLSDSPPKVKE